MSVAVQGRSDQAALELGFARGYFAQQGLDITTVQFDSGAQMVPALANNQIQVGNGAPSASLFNALNRGIDIRIVADYAHVGPPQDATLALMVRQDLADTIKSTMDFAGRTVALGTVPGTVSDYMYQGALKEYGTPSTDPDVKYLAFPDILASLAGKSIEAGTLTEPTVTQAVAQKIATVLYPAGAVIPGSHLSVLQFAPDFARAQPDAATRFMVGYLQGVRDYFDAFIGNKNREEVIAILSQRLSVTDPEVWRTAGPEYIDLNGRVSLQDLINQATFYQAQGTLTGALPDIASFVDVQFADAAVGQLGARSDGPSL